MKNFEFEIDGIKYTVPPQGYTESNGDLGYKCMVFISHRHDIEAINLGNVFLRNFVLSYEYERGRVKLGLNVNAPAGAAITKTHSDPDHHGGHSDSAKKGLGIAIGVLILLAVVVVIWYCVDKRRQRT